MRTSLQRAASPRVAAAARDDAGGARKVTADRSNLSLGTDPEASR